MKAAKTNNPAKAGTALAAAPPASVIEGTAGEVGFGVETRAEDEVVEAEGEVEPGAEVAGFEETDTAELDGFEEETGMTGMVVVTTEDPEVYTLVVDDDGIAGFEETGIVVVTTEVPEVYTLVVDDDGIAGLLEAGTEVELTGLLEAGIELPGLSDTGVESVSGQ
ncbi:uncharacterized protein LODBEIA_P40340 [Lodderomyces beijingensis]|uniref:DUF5666 domain-containing protein n=1 Tax=Lodderomyces beijingensis TaxID=1775926 RepID=A0ABP0ZUG4_9ASCO